MTPPVKCPVCGSELKEMTTSHMHTKKHQEALKKEKIDPSDDPALKLIEKPQESDKEEIEYKSETYLKLDVPEIPEPPKKQKLELNSANVSISLTAMKKAESQGKKPILVNCRRCNGVIFIPVPVDLIINSELPVVPISYVHENKDNNDKHCITIYLDHDFDIRRQRLSDVILEE